MKKKIISKSNFFSFLLIVIFCAFTLVLAGCTGEDGASIADFANDVIENNDVDNKDIENKDIENNDIDNTNESETKNQEIEDTLYSGMSKILGKINLSSLVGSDYSSVKGSSVSSLLRNSNSRARGVRYLEDSTSDNEIDSETEIVKLYIYGEDGELEDTGINCSCRVDPEDEDKIIYDCDKVKDGVNYVVKYIKLLGNNKAVELKASAYVEVGVTEFNTDVTAKTSAIVESLRTAILDATLGTGITQNTVNKIVNAVKKVIENLVNAGSIQLPSMIVETEGNTLAEVLGEGFNNDNLTSTSGTLVSNETVGTQLDAIKTEIESEKFNLTDVITDDQKENLVKRVFKEMLGDDGEDSPGFMIEFLSDKFKEGVTKTVNEITSAVQSGLMFRKPWPADEPCTKDNALAAFKDALSKMYELIADKQAGTITDVDLKKFADVPPVVMGLFNPIDKDKWLSIDSATALNIPQCIALTIFIVDGYIADAYESANIKGDMELTEGDGGVVNHEKEEPFEFDAMSRGSLLDILGFAEVADEYAGTDIFELWIHPSKCWIDDENGGKDMDMLNAGTCWGDVAGMLVNWDDNNTSPDYSTAAVTLTYPKKGGGTGTIQLLSEAELRGREDEKVDMWNNCWILDPWMEVNQEDKEEDVWNEPDPERIVSDFTSGTYKISVTWNGETISKEFTRKVITGMSDIYPILTSPAPMPPWPGNDATEAEMEQHFEDMQEYTMTNFSATEKTDDVEDAAKITISWKAPVLDAGVLPEGVKMGYELDLGQGGCDEFGCDWEQIYSTWEHDKLLFGTSFTIPVLIKKQQQGEHPYQLNIHIVFIDQETGNRLGEGGHAHGEFTVCDPLVLTNTFTITGKVDITDCQNEALALADVENIKVALFHETYDENSFTNAWTRTILKIGTMATVGNEIIYSITPTIGDFLGDNNDAQGWHNIIIFQDVNNNNAIDDMLDAEPWNEPQWWPEGGNNLWFDTWGGTLRVHSDNCEADGTCYNKEIVIVGGEQINGSDFRVQTWNDCYQSDNDMWENDDNLDQNTTDEPDNPDDFDMPTDNPDESTENSNTIPTATITTPSDRSSYTDTETISFSGTGNDAEDGTLSGNSLVWTSSLDGQIGTGSNFTTDDLSVGEHTITLSAADSGSATGSYSITVTITTTATSNTPPTAVISTPSHQSSYTVLDVISFSGTGSDTEDGTLSESSLVWTSSLDGQIGTGSNFTRNDSTVDLSMGEHTITFSVTDSENATASDSIIITITTSNLI